MRISDWSSDVCSSDLAALAPWLPTFLDDQIKLNDFGASDHIIAALAEHGWTAPLLLARGDLYRAHGNPRDLVEAAEFYGKAVEMDESLPEAQRGLGLALIKTGRRTEGQSALRRYLELKPPASDASMIRMLASAEGGKSEYERMDARRCYWCRCDVDRFHGQGVRIS